MLAKPVRMRRGPSDARLEAVLRQLPPEALKELRDKIAAPPKPKRRTGRPLILLTGQRFGKRTVGPRANKPRQVFCACLCDCGNLALWKLATFAECKRVLLAVRCRVDVAHDGAPCSSPIKR